MKISTTTATLTQVLDRDDKGHGVWFQNHSTTATIYIVPECSRDFVTGDASAGETSQFILPPAADATHPTSLLIQSSGGDTTLVASKWYAYQASGGNIDFYCGRW